MGPLLCHIHRVPYRKEQEMMRRMRKSWCLDCVRTRNCRVVGFKGFEGSQAYIGHGVG